MRLHHLRAPVIHGCVMVVREQGALPEALGSLQALEQFVLSDNALTGAVPAYIGGYPGVGEAWLQRNALSGTLPVGLCANPAGRDRIHLEVCHKKCTLSDLE